jgi:hypothetical protein
MKWQDIRAGVFPESPGGKMWFLVHLRLNRGSSVPISPAFRTTIARKYHDNAIWLNPEVW